MPNDILSALDRDDVSFLTILNPSAAFDITDHAILIYMLHTLYGVSGFNPIFLTRPSYGGWLNVCTTVVPVSSWVFQSFVLGPILFIMYTKQLSTLIQAHSVSFSQLYTICSPTQRCIQRIQDCISDCRWLWVTPNNLKLNESRNSHLLLH